MEEKLKATKETWERKKVRAWYSHGRRAFVEARRTEEEEEEKKEEDFCLSLIHI